ncbi:aldo/keto reductase [Herbaspirillum huttiense]|uniref:aldo/keto reductase n=1 Tax=Herbaspirillum huttiense TaxID=863372 RepID=UPI0039B0F3D2
MQYSLLGRSGLLVSRLSLGTMTFGGGTGIWGKIAGVDRQAAMALISAALDHGVNLFDTADAYSQGQSETILGEALSALGIDDTRMMVATKVRLRTGPGHNDVGLGRSHIMRSVETSLRRLKRDHIDLFQLHDRDALVPLEETLRALDDLVTQGKVRHIGACNFSGADLERAHAISRQAHLASLTSNQVYYSLAARDIEHDITRIAQANRVGLIVWSPLSGGYLSGKYTAGAPGAGAGRRADLNFPPIDPLRGDPIVFALREIADELQAQPAQVALAWTLARPAISSITLGARTVEQLRANLASIDMTLAAPLDQRLCEVSKQSTPYPYWMQEFHDQDRVAS